jgi:glycosyltransferase involved in cell wall biosynthesis
MSNRKVIHIVESLDKGAVENWLIRMYDYGIKTGLDLDWTFYCIEAFEGRQEAKVKSLGASVIHSANAWNKPFKLIKELRKELKRGGYDVLHCHHDFMSALYLLASNNLIPKKLVHVHNMDEHIPTNSKLKASILRPIFRRICWYKADKIVGISKHTLKRFILNKKSIKKKSTLHYYGVNPLPFYNVKREETVFRFKFKLNENNKVLLFASRLAPAKNPLFAVEVLKEMVAIDKRVVGFFVGSGDLEDQILEKLEAYNLKENFRFIGWSDQIPYLMKNSDLFILPHIEYPMEGLGLVILEAQLADLPVIMSNGVSLDPILPNSLYKQLSLNDGAYLWAKEAVKLINERETYVFKVKEDFEASNFKMKTAYNNLLRLYND